MEKFLSHTDFTNGYRIKYPAAWRKQSLAPTATGFFSSLEGSADMFSDNVNVLVDQAEVTLDEYVKNQIAMMTAAGSTLKLTKRTETRAAGLPAITLEFSGQLGPVMKEGQVVTLPMRWMQVYVLKDKRMYCVTYTAEPKSYDKYLEQVKEMVDSLELN